MKIVSCFDWYLGSKNFTSFARSLLVVDEKDNVDKEDKASNKNVIFVSFKVSMLEIGSDDTRIFANFVWIRFVNVIITFFVISFCIVLRRWSNSTIIMSRRVSLIDNIERFACLSTILLLTTSSWLVVVDDLDCFNVIDDCLLRKVSLTNVIA